MLSDANSASPAGERLSAARRAVVLLSGGLDSATVLAMVVQQGFEAHALSFDYGQRHMAELAAARQLAQSLGATAHRVVSLDLAGWGGSSLTDPNIAIPTERAPGIPNTYVPARNTIFLSLALAWAETLGAVDIFAGMNAIDYSGYPDCRPEYVAAFQYMARLATRAGVDGAALTIHTPIITMGKAEIIRTGTALGVDYAKTVSCYQADSTGRACGRCDACTLRRDGFRQAGIADVTRYFGT